MSSAWGLRVLKTYVDRSAVALVLLSAAALSACGGGGGGGNGGNPPPPSGGTLQFSAGSFSVDESAGTASITVTRTGNSNGAVSVTLASSEGTAKVVEDYAALSTSVSFADGDTAAKTVAVTITDDATVEGDETFNLALSAPTGGAGLGTAATATVTIRSDEPPSAPTLTVGSDIKQLKFSWAGVAGAANYRLLESPDGVAPFTQIGAEHPAAATSATLDIAVHRLNWANASYRLDACNTLDRCTESAVIGVVGAMIEAIGYFKASNTDAGDSFGFSVAMSADGNTLAVGAIEEDSAATGVNRGDASDNGAEDSGAVYVFTRSNDGLWSQQAYVKASNPDIADEFGSSVALSADGNTLAVGAAREDSAAKGLDGDQSDNSSQEAGAVYVFTRNNGLWSQQAYVKASNTESDDVFGVAVALSADGSTLAVGAAGEASNALGVSTDPDAQNNNEAPRAGAVYVFTRSGTVWSQQAYVKASNTDEADVFGRSVALSADGSTLAVGALGEASAATGVGGNQDDDSAQVAGAVYVFTRIEAAWSQQAYLKAFNTDAGDGFGRSVALSADGSTLTVGSSGEDSNAKDVDGNQGDNSAQGAGAVYVFTRIEAAWSQQAYVKAFNTDAGDFFGSLVALSADGNTLAVGAAGEDSAATGVNGDGSDNNAVETGAAYVFTRSETTWSQQAYVKASNTRAFGDDNELSVALSADGNTLAVGSLGEDSNARGVDGDQANQEAPFAGAVYLY